MEPVLLKYRSNDHDYLVFDTLKNDTFLDPHAVRAICSYNCGLGSMGIVAGPFEGSDGKMTVKFYTPEGQETQQNREPETFRSFHSDENAGSIAEFPGMSFDSVKAKTGSAKIPSEAEEISSEIVEEGLRAGFCYLLDAGYLSGSDRDSYEARPVGKVFLSENAVREIFSAC